MGHPGPELWPVPPSALRRAIDRVEKARQKYLQTLFDVQLNCTHEHVVEADHKPSIYGGALPPLKVCRTCGMSEDGWGPGYQVLKAAAVRVPRDTAYSLRRGLMLGNEHKGPLIRRELVVADLVRNHFSDKPLQLDVLVEECRPLKGAL
jgi:hypothetical protein